MDLNRSKSDLSITQSPLSKNVTIQDEPEEINLPSTSNYENTQAATTKTSPRLHRASIGGKKMTGRMPMTHSNSSLHLSRQISSLSLDKLDNEELSTKKPPDDPSTILAQVAEWLSQEKAKRSGHGLHRPHLHHAKRRSHTHDHAGEEQDLQSSGEPLTHQNSAEIALEKLEIILASFSSGTQKHHAPRLGHKASSNVLRRGSLARTMRKNSAPASSDTEFQDGDLLVPNVEATLDNSKAMTYSGGSVGPGSQTKESCKNQQHWNTFKEDIVRLTHTLRLKGWRRIPIEMGHEIEVKRLSGALTNAVYVVTPPKTLPEPENQDGVPAGMSRRRPVELLLRVYGPQVEHLIDRDAELQILRRLARKRIGPRMLGTFTNGRFEEFFHARTLTASDIRDPATSKQIAKRMRELHDGIELLQSELEDGPRVFTNWYSWVARCEQVITWLDKRVQKEQEDSEWVNHTKYTRLGYICGVAWPFFRKTVERYHEHLVERYGGKTGLREHLVFAHNDTQYGNLMRLSPEGESPISKPANEHKQLVVIDFEYASPNTPGLEFANHFTEWCYNYHDTPSFGCNTGAYPTPEEQYRFIRSYVMHRPQFSAAASATPQFEGREKTNIPDFMLDARAPGGSSSIDYEAEERGRQEKQEKDVQQLIRDTRMWRAANSAMWVAWAIVQAKVPELDAKPKSRAGMLVNMIKTKMHPQSDPLGPEEKALQEDAKHDRPEGREQEEAHEEGEVDEDEEGFDYLAYAQERAMFFWGDCLQMGFVKPEELPKRVQSQVKIVKY